MSYMDPAEHASDQLLVVYVPVSHVDHGFMDAGQAVDQDLGGALDPFDVRTVGVVKLFALLLSP
ncbi:hypothetical protein ACF09I_00820 [Streptomyces sp. NPDC014940]|uniref:hypothetical protein n=1 Tax=Streptomyces sp. NPDC014940 TaxID=3364932 RepID=UPI0036F71213